MDDESSLPFSLPDSSIDLYSRREIESHPSAATNNFPEEDDDDEIARTTAEVLDEMKTAFINECCAPILLPHKYEAAECLLDQVDGMEANIDNCKNRTSLKVAAHKMEVLRIGFMVNDYLRTRLEKIEKNSRGILKQHNSRIEAGKTPLLAEEEAEFLSKYTQAESKLLRTSLFNSLPPTFRRIPVAEVNTEHERVFCRVIADDVENVEVPDYQDKNGDVIVEMNKDTVHLIPLKSIQDHVENGKVVLM